MTLLSVIVPVYKNEKYLTRCIQSIQNQSFTDFELILVIDGSPAGFPGCAQEICLDFAQKDSRIRVIIQENQGVTAARLRGLKESTGRYISFVDSDDWLEPEMYRRMIQPALKYKTDMVLCDFFLSFPKKEKPFYQPLIPGFYDKERLLKEIYPSMLFSQGKDFRRVTPALWSKLFLRETALNNLSAVPASLSFGEDLALTYPALLDSRSIFVLDKECLYHYRQHPSSVMAGYKKDFLSKIFLLCDYLQRASDSKGVYDLSEQILGNLCYFAVHSLFNETLDPVKRKDLKSFAASLCEDSRVREAIERTDLSRFFYFYKKLTRFIEEKRLGTILFICRFYPLIVRLLKQVL